jgi:hypothetical protein
MSYYALGNISTGNKDFTRGQEVTDLTPEQAQPLIDFGVLSEDAPAEDTIVEPGVTAADTTPVEHPAIDEGIALAEQAAPVAAQDPLEPQPAEAEQSPAPAQAPTDQPADSLAQPLAPVSVKVEKIK